MNFFERYADRIMPEPNSGCWLWIGAFAGKGYGHINDRGRSVYTHRLAYEQANGAGSAKGLVIRHRCDNPPCCNPDHLQGGTHSDNHNDKYSRGRGYRPFGELAVTAKLTAEIVYEIRRLFNSGWKIRDIRCELGLQHLKRSTIHNAAKGISWSHLPPREK